MKLYDSSYAPNPRRVRMFIAEKGINIPKIEVNLMTGEHKSAEFAGKNSTQRVPVLELDNGEYLSESTAICHYLEALHPEPNLCGKTPLEAAQIEMWDRQMELDLFFLLGMTFRNTTPIFKGRMPQVAEWAEVCRKGAIKKINSLNDHLGDSAYIAGERFTIADITAYIALDFFMPHIGLQIENSQQHLRAWFDKIAQRSSAKA